MSKKKSLFSCSPIRGPRVFNSLSALDPHAASDACSALAKNTRDLRRTYWAPPAAPPAPMRSGAPNPPNPRSARPGGRAHRLGGRGRRLGGREHAHRRGRRRSRRIGLPRASRQARFMAVKKEPLRSGGRIGRRCMPGGWGGAGEAGGGLGGAQFS